MIRLDLVHGANCRSGRPDPVDVHVGTRLRELRRSRGLSQTDIGQAVGVTPQQIQKYERGTNRISAPMLYAMAQSLEVTPDTYFDGLPEQTRTGMPRTGHDET